MALLDDVYNRLTTAAVIAAGWPGYKGYLPDDGADQAIAIYETGGYPSDTLGNENDLPTFQVAIRGTNYGTCRAKWVAMRAALDNVMPSAAYHLLNAQSTAPIVVRDAKGRIVMTLNFRVVKTRE